MKKQRVLASIITSLSICVVGLALLKNNNTSLFSRATNEPYKMVMNSSKNKFHSHTGSTAYSGEATVQTNLNNDISFSYTDFMGLASTWHVAKSGGYFYNTTPIHGLQTISLLFKTNEKQFKIYWSNSTSFNETDSQLFVSSTSSITIFNFDNDCPTYFKFVNTSESNLNISEIELEFSCQNNYPTLSISSENDSLGTVSGPTGIIRSGENITIIATPKVGVSFLGWYDNNNNLVSSLSTYSFAMPYEDLTYVARFDWAQYYVNVTVNDNSMGSVSGAGYYIYQQEVTLIATPNEHYSFLGWYDSSEISLISKEPVYVFSMHANSMSFRAKFVQNHNLYIYSEDENKGTVSYPSECGEGLEVTISATGKNGYGLDYWYDDDLNNVSYHSTYTFIMPNHDVTLYASFAEGYELTVTSSDVSKGTVFGAGYYVPGRYATVGINHISGKFKGWFNDNNQRLSVDNSYTFTMPSKNYSIEARFMTQAEEEEWDKAHGVIPVLSQDGKTITYGLYPQANVNDDSLVSSLNALTTPESNGWYFYNNEYYVKIEADPYTSVNFYFDNGEYIFCQEYWFKCEPITWNVLSNNNGNYLLLSSVLLDTQRYNEAYDGLNDKGYYANNYKNSEIRNWLNNDFYNSAFALNDDYIQITTVDNSASSIPIDSSAPYACENTNDKIFLLSLSDYLNEDYGFSSDTNFDSSKRCVTTDWTRARGAFAPKAFSYYGYYWTRSPYNKDNYATFINASGGILYSNSNEFSVDAESKCVRPSLVLTLD